jgi:hypothetical protein
MAFAPSVSVPCPAIIEEGSDFPEVNKNRVLLPESFTGRILAWLAPSVPTIVDLFSAPVLDFLVIIPIHSKGEWIKSQGN